MKKGFRIATVLVALGAIFGSVILALAQGRPIVGGYKEVATDDAEVVAAAEFAVGAQGEQQNATIKLVSVEHAERQVVAGTNYRLCLKVEVSSEDEGADTTQEAKVVVFRSLKKEYSLKSWEEEQCSESQ